MSPSPERPTGWRAGWGAVRGLATAVLVIAVTVTSQLSPGGPSTAPGPRMVAPAAWMSPQDGPGDGPGGGSGDGGTGTAVAPAPNSPTDSGGDGGPGPEPEAQPAPAAQPAQPAPAAQPAPTAEAPVPGLLGPPVRVVPPPAKPAPGTRPGAADMMTWHPALAGVPSANPGQPNAGHPAQAPAANADPMTQNQGLASLMLPNAGQPEPNLAASLDPMARDLTFVGLPTGPPSAAAMQDVLLIHPVLAPKPPVPMSGSHRMSADPDTIDVLRDYQRDSALKPGSLLNFSTTPADAGLRAQLVQEESGDVERVQSAVKKFGGPNATVTQTPMLLRDDEGRFRAITLFTVTRPDGESRLVDAQGAHYSGMKDYREHNQLPDDWTLVRPADPSAPGEAQRLVSDSAHHTTFGQRLGKIGDDLAGPVTIVGGALILTASGIGEAGTGGLGTPVAAPAAAFGAGMVLTGAGWTAGRAAQDLYDRYQHGRSLSFSDPQARADYLGMAFSALNMLPLTRPMRERVAGMPSGVANAGNGTDAPFPGLTPSDGITGLPGTRSLEATDPTSVGPPVPLSPSYNAQLDAHFAGQSGLKEQYQRDSVTPTSELSPEAAKSVIGTRRSIKLAEGDRLVKVLTKDAVERILTGKYSATTINGSIARESDIAHLRTFQQLRDGLGLDDSVTVARQQAAREQALAKGKPPPDWDGRWNPIPEGATTSFEMHWTATDNVGQQSYIPFGGPAGENVEHMRGLLADTPGLDPQRLHTGDRPFTGTGSTVGGVPEWIADRMLLGDNPQIMQRDPDGTLTPYAHLDPQTNTWILD